MTFAPGRDFARPGAVSVERVMDSSKNTRDIYAELSKEFDQVHEDDRGGVKISYITGEQCVSRLNEVLGVAGWNFRVLEHAVNTEADEIWTLGELTAEIDGRTVTRQQFGSQKLKRSRSSGQILDIGFDLKAATTDALKKCASLIGVGLYLSHKESRAAVDNKRQAARSGSATRATAAASDGDGLHDCSAKDCTRKVKDGPGIYAFDGVQLSGKDILIASAQEFKRIFCMEHLVKARAAKAAKTAA